MLHLISSPLCMFSSHLPASSLYSFTLANFGPDHSVCSRALIDSLSPIRTSFLPDVILLLALSLPDQCSTCPLMLSLLLNVHHLLRAHLPDDGWGDRRNVVWCIYPATQHFCFYFVPKLYSLQSQYLNQVDFSWISHFIKFYRILDKSKRIIEIR